MAGSEWTKSQDGLLWFKSSVKTIVKLGQNESAWAWVKLDLADFGSKSNWAKKSIWVPCIMCVQYIGGCSVHWRDTMSTSGDIMSTMGGVQYIGRIP